MFRAKHKISGKQFYIIGKDAASRDILQPLVENDFLICENCAEPLILKRGFKDIWQFEHKPKTWRDPFCQWRFAKLRKLLEIQIDNLTEQLGCPEIQEILTDQHLNISEEVHRYLEHLEQTTLRLKNKKESVSLPTHCICKICGEPREDWIELEFDTGMGICRACLKRLHEQEHARNDS